MKKAVIFGGLAVVALAAVYPLVAKELAGQEQQTTAKADAESVTAQEPAAGEAAAKKEEQASGPASALVATVNGDPITKQEVVDAMEGSFAARGMQLPDIDSLPPEVRKNIIESYVTERLILEKAKEAGVGSDPKVQEEIRRASERILAKNYLQNIADQQVTEEAIKAEYAKASTNMGGQPEVRARHILVETEEEAKTIAKAIKEEGADFEALAKEKSTDKSNSGKGGDLGYFTKNKMVPEFSKAAFALEVGQVSEPVKTDFGWHIIKLEDKRDSQPPSLETMRPAIKHALENEAVQGVVQQTLSGADITYYDKDGKAMVDAAANAAAASPAAGAGQSFPPAGSGKLQPKQ